MGVKTVLPLFALLIGAAVSLAPLERSNFELEPFNTNVDEPAYRLLDNVQPSYVQVDLDVYLNESRFNGLVQITVSVNEANLEQIVLHQKVVSINTVTVLDSNNLQVPLQFPEPFTTDDYYEIVHINFADPIAVGEYTIIISYNGVINENPVDRGFYKGYYYLNDVKHEYATTQFQPYHARKAFPCFDEPQFKSVFVISITRDSSLSPSYSNMAINANLTEQVTTGRIRETFLPTPIISAYLIAFHVSDFEETTATGTAEKPFGIVSRQGVSSQHAYAAEIGLAITDELSEYLDFDYYTHGQGQPMKNDHIALPDFPSGAMENWGMVNYREAYLLYDENNTNLLNKIFIATIMAHELAHKWFGNLVTCFWWSNLWLNESYASFFEYFGAHYADPSLELDEQFVVDYVHSALSSDAGAGANPMNWTGVSSNPTISAHFSVTSYAKGASVLRMLEHLVGAEIFRNALRIYLQENQYGLGTPVDMYNGFRQAVATDSTFAATYPGIDIGEVFDSWVQTAGSPVLNVDVNMNTGVVTIEQARFQLTGTPHTNLWQIPITWTREGDIDFEDTKPSFVLTERSTTIEIPAGHDWVIFNKAQSGLYRVNYDDHNWQHIASYLRGSNRENIHKLNRAQIVNDVLFFIRSGSITISRAFDVLSFLEYETDYYVWAGALGQLDWIRRRLEHVPLVYDEFNVYLLDLLDNVIQHVGYEENENDSTSAILNRMQILNYACNLGHAGCIEDSLQKWQAYRTSNTAVGVNYRRYVYCIGLREGDASDYNFLFNVYNASSNTADMVVILRALACTRDTASLQHYLDQSMYNDRIRIHDKTNAFSFALLGNRENLDTVLNFLFENFEEIESTYGGPARLQTAVGALATYLTDFQDILRFQTWLYENQVALGPSFGTGQGVVTTAMNNLVWSNNVVQDVYAYLRQRNAASGATASVLVIMVGLVAHLLK